MYIDYHFNAKEAEHARPEFWYVSSCFYNEHSDLNLIKKTIQDDLASLNQSSSALYSYITDEMISDFKIDASTGLRKIVSNYIYDLEKMKTFAGRKLQKKRNHLNAFMLQNHNVKIKNIREIELQDLLNYLESHMQRYAEVYRTYEIDVYKKYLLEEMPKDKNYFGTVIYIDDRIVGLTFCYLHPEVCEVIIEKGELDVRGLYQFIIKENLLLHNITVPYMDRQDDMDLEALAHSKKSYYPSSIIHRHIIFDDNGGSDDIH